MKGPEGAFVLTEDLIEEKDLRPGRTTEERSAPGFALRVRAYLEVFPGAFWETPEEDG